MDRPVEPPKEPGTEPYDQPSGPGLEAKDGVDPTLVTAWIFVLIGFTPTGIWLRVLGFDRFGPLEVSAILAMVGVLFGFIALLRAIDLADVRLRAMAIGALVLGLGRLFLLPLF